MGEPIETSDLYTVVVVFTEVNVHADGFERDVTGVFMEPPIPPKRFL